MTFVIRLKDGSWQRYESSHKNRDAVVKEILTRYPDADYIEALQPSPSGVVVKFKKLRPDAVAPYKAHPTDAGFDLTATSRKIDSFGNVVYGTGLAFEIPAGYVGLLFPRSSICLTDLALTNAVGVCDACYRGEVMFKFKPSAHMRTEQRTGHEIGYAWLSDAPHVYALGERIGQMVVVPIPAVSFVESDTLSESDRGAGGYGSTGK